MTTLPPSPSQAPAFAALVRTTGARGRSLQESLQSLALQSLPCIAVVIVHGSLETYARVREGCGQSGSPDLVRVLHAPDMDPRRKRGYPINVGLDYCLGQLPDLQYLFLLDDDDIVYPFFTGTMALAFRASEADVVYATANCREAGKPLTAAYPYRPYTHLFDRNFIPSNGYAIRAEALRRCSVRVAEDLDYLEDWLFLLRLLESGLRFYGLDTTLSEFRAESAADFAHRHDLEVSEIRLSSRPSLHQHLGLSGARRRSRPSRRRPLPFAPRGRGKGGISFRRFLHDGRPSPPDLGTRTFLLLEMHEAPARSGRGLVAPAQRAEVGRRRVTPGITALLPLLVRDPGSSEVSRLLRAAGSVLSQECDLPLELLIVDDGSEPEARSLPALRPLLDDGRVRLIRLARNYGIASALNAGLTQARYGLIARIDADDVWRPGKLARQAALLRADPDLTLVASSMRLVHPDSPHLDRDDLRGGDWAHALSLTERIGCPFPHGSVLARREVFERVGGYPQAAVFQHAEDFALWAQWIRFFKVAICDEVLFEYTVSEEQISARFAAEQRKAAAAAQRALRVLAAPARIPQAVGQMAMALGLDLLSASSVLFTAWKYYEFILADAGSYETAAALFPDRAVHRWEDVHTLLADRFFYLHRGPLDRPLQSARSVHTVDDVPCPATGLA